MSETLGGRKRLARDYTLHLTDSDWKIISKAFQDWDFPQPFDPANERYWAFDRLRDEIRRACLPWLHDPDWNMEWS